MSDNQKTLNSSIEFTGVGLHTGECIHMVIEPAIINHGVKFQRIDLENQPILPRHKVIIHLFARERRKDYYQKCL